MTGEGGRSDTEMREWWRGGVEAWECDEMGHMNVRFWVRRAMEGIAVMAPELGCALGFTPGASATLLPLEQHIRFHREAPAGMPLFLRGGIVAWGEETLEVYGEIVQSRTGLVGATFLTTLAHVEARSGRMFQLSGRTRDAASLLKVIVPDHGRPRSVPMDTPLPDGNAALAAKAGFTRVGLGAVRADEVDSLGRLFTEGFIGRVSQAVPNLLSGWRDDVAAEAAAADGVARRPGAAVLEYRLSHRAWPRVGDLVEVWSGVTRVEDKTHALQHWLVDPRDGKPWCVCEAVAVTFDLIARKAMMTPPKARAALEGMRVRLP